MRFPQFLDEIFVKLTGKEKKDLENNLVLDYRSKEEKM